MKPHPRIRPLLKLLQFMWKQCIILLKNKRNVNMENQESVYIKQIKFPIAIDGVANANHTNVYLSDGRMLSGVQSAAVVAECDNALRYRIEGVLVAND